jgi:hypothetical protein
MAESEAFRKWQKRESSRRLGMEADVEREVERQLQPANIRTEVHDDRGRWVETAEDELID